MGFELTILIEAFVLSGQMVIMIDRFGNAEMLGT